MLPTCALIFAFCFLGAAGVKLDIALKSRSLLARAGAAANNSALVPQATYDGGYSNATEIKLRIANGGAGQSGLIGAWANAFIQYSVETLGQKPFKVKQSSLYLRL